MWLPDKNKSNDYLVDRERQRTVNFTGITGVNDQDRAVQEGMGIIVDRSEEHLGTADVAIVAMRKHLLSRARLIADGGEPDVPRDGSIYNVRSLDVVTTEGDFDGLLAGQAGHLRGQA
jgi:hypothetical protein